ncbi:Metallo-dependent phosphatase-like protein [Endogone sp. FLAS-F59071]|nr:Metallo-dependent phosphatase-like protein [Endogone sp. FLAS-F59071]|eukprot:RUS21884.1 Metallo-dependent phosphatase-like protein [Endogone sp. FLAS-F59071]
MTSPTSSQPFAVYADTGHALSGKQPNTIRFVCMSDTHNNIKYDFQIPEGDVFIHAGDLTRTGKLSDCERTLQWLKELPHPIKLVIAGNHDLTFDTEHYEKTWQHWHDKKEDDGMIKRLYRQANEYGVFYLEDEMFTLPPEYGGFKCWGAPWQPEFFSWGFNLERGPKIAAKWAEIPLDTDILITHGPPANHLSYTMDGIDAGCEDLLDRIKTVRPRAHIFGHIHEGYGFDFGTATERTEGILFVNASTCTLRYRPTNPPIVFDLPMTMVEPVDTDIDRSNRSLVSDLKIAQAFLFFFIDFISSPCSLG